ncbi:MAG TPA: hypothetical protein VES20_10330 [Bryobacteraceae bacterium]|nr:hypothetical protein [Bryobacteraceae bacterium]
MLKRFVVAVTLAGCVWAADESRPGLFLREDFKETPAATPITQDHVANPELVLSVHGPGKSGVKKSHHDKPADDPYYVWSGTATGNWAVSVRHRKLAADLSGLAKIRWRTKQAGFRQLRLLVKTADGRWLVSDFATGPSNDWHEAEIPVSNIRWRALDPQNIVEKRWVDNPDLTRVDEVGFTDLMTGGGSDACSRIDWIEVWAKPVPRTPR